MAGKIVLLLGATVWLSMMPSSAFAETDTEKGKRYYDSRCKVCHNITGSAHKVGPTLNRFLGKQAGTIEGFKYSADWKAAGVKGLKWSDQSFLKYMAKGDEFIGGFIGKNKAKTKMFFTTIRSDDDSANLLAYIKGLK